MITKYCAAHLALPASGSHASLRAFACFLWEAVGSVQTSSIALVQSKTTVSGVDDDQTLSVQVQRGSGGTSGLIRQTLCHGAPGTNY